MPELSIPHLVIPFARCEGDAWLAAMRAQPAGSLKNLGKLLQGMKLVNLDPGAAHSLSTPHERVLARAQGLDAASDGLIPWAALEANAGTAKAWAFITPCHWAMGREHATMTDPAALALTPEDSQTLLAAMQPYFETEGIALHYAAPERWLAEGEVFRKLPTASLDRVLGRNVDPWLSTSKAMKLLQNEMQMLLYTHPSNNERSAKRLLPVNSFWISGTGALNRPVQQPKKINVPRTLAQAAFKDDWAAYVKAWGEIDAIGIAQLLVQQNAGQAVRLSLCGERSAQTFETTAQSFFNKISHRFKTKNPLDLLSQL
jgi:hypothetical protein